MLLAVVSLVLLIGACGEDEEEEVPPLKIGQLNSFTGDLSDVGGRTEMPAPWL